MQTYGWDTVFLCSMERVNDCLRDKMSQLITTFAYDDGGVRMSGVFDAWRLVPGGSDKLLHFEIPIQSGTASFLGKDYDLAGIVPEMQLHAFIDNARAEGASDLHFDCLLPGKKPGDTTPGAVTTVTPDVGTRLDRASILWGMLHDNLPKCLIANRDRLAYVFASVNPGIPGDQSWMSPKRFDYVYAEPVGGKTGCLGILSVVTDRDTSGLPRDVDPALTAGAESDDLFLLISPELFMKHVVMPGLPAAYGHGASPGSFVYTAGAVKNNGRLDCGTFREGMIDYHPYLDTLTIGVQGSALRTVANGSFDITGLTDAYVTFSVDSTNECLFDPATQQVRFAPDPHASHNYDKHIPWWEEALAVLGGPIIVAIVVGVIEGITDSVAASIVGSLNSGGNLSIAAAAPVAVRWQGLEQMHARDAGLSGAFYVRGTYAG